MINKKGTCQNLKILNMPDQISQKELSNSVVDTPNFNKKSNKKLFRTIIRRASNNLSAKLKLENKNIHTINRNHSENNIFTYKISKSPKSKFLKINSPMNDQLSKKNNCLRLPNTNDLVNIELVSEKQIIKSMKSKMDQLLGMNKMSKNLDSLRINEKSKPSKNKKNFTKFNINDNEQNKKFNFKNNEVITTKYNFFNFLPKGLLIQFVRLSNIYFLLIAIIQSISIISPLTPATAIIPLIFVLSVSLLRELFEDYSRHVYDNLNNIEKIFIFRNGYFSQGLSKTIQRGEIIYIRENRTIPADMLLIETGNEEGTCYIDTSSLDGEKSLKLKVANKKTCDILKQYIKTNMDIEKVNFGKYIKINGQAQVEFPNCNLNQIEGSIEIKISVKKNNDKVNTETVNFPITNKEFLLKGSILKNTNWIIGVVLYTGKDNKIILNSKKPRIKTSLLEKNTNKFLCYVFLFIVFCCFVAVLLCYKDQKRNEKFFNSFISSKQTLSDTFIIFFTYFLLLNTLIPISLVVTLEIIKLILGFFIEWDVQLYSKYRKVFCKANTVSIIEELGNINFVFSDKTGTLTMNILKFKYCIINETCYEYKRLTDFRKSEQKNFQESMLNKLKFSKNIKIFEDNYFINFIEKERSEVANIQLKGITNFTEMHNLINRLDEVKMIHDFWIALSLTNECMITEEKGEIKYIGTSPDDLELLKTAASQGYRLIKNSVNQKIIKIGKNGNIIEFEVMNILGFTSERKRMSIIVRDPSDGRIKIFCKGADCEIIKRLSKDELQKKSFKIVTNNIENFSKLGYRTLMVAYKSIDEMDYQVWMDRLKKEELNLHNKAYFIDKCYDIMENDFELLGGTVVEDRLQDNVPNTIQSLRKADIKVWVLTGDKIDTLESIGLSSNLLSKNDKIFKIGSIIKDDENITQNNIIEIKNFFKEFNLFLEKTIKKNKIKISPTIYQSNFAWEKNDSNIKNSILSNKIPHNIIKWNNLKYLIKKNLLEDYCILIESQILNTIFADLAITEKFLTIASMAKTVICCRVSSFQKSQVVKKMKLFDSKAITLAIGDGSNDVAMLMEAHIGIGIFGEEGRTAVQSSDFAIGEFKYLERLLFFHGRIDRSRILNMVNYFFYKNFIFSITQIFFAFYNLSSGQTIMDDWFITCYNLIFTALPLCVVAISDTDLKQKDMDNIKELTPFIYKERRAYYNGNSFNNFFYTILRGTILSIIICFVCISGNIIDNEGSTLNIWTISLKIYTCILLIVSLNLFIDIRFIVFYLPIVIIASSFILYILFLLLVHYGLLFEFNSKATVFPTVFNLRFLMDILIVCALTIIVDYSTKIYTILFDKSIIIAVKKNWEEIKNIPSISNGGEETNQIPNIFIHKNRNLLLNQAGKHLTHTENKKNINESSFIQLNVQ